MDRFFSKLDLRDIKIQPETKFPPTEEDYDNNGIEENWEDEDFDEVEVDVASNNDEAHAPFRAVDVAVDVAVAVEVVEQRKDVLKVSARSRPSAVAGAIAGVVRESGRAEVQAIGAGATNQAVKAVAIARDYLRETNIEAVCLPAFIDVTIDNEDRTAIRIIVEPR